MSLPRYVAGVRPELTGSRWARFTRDLLSQHPVCANCPKPSVHYWRIATPPSPPRPPRSDDVVGLCTQHFLAASRAYLDGVDRAVAHLRDHARPARKAQGVADVVRKREASVTRTARVRRRERRTHLK